MAKNTWQSILRCLSKTFRLTEQTDGDLLERFIHQREEDAFATLVLRHGSMVFSACRRVLRDDDDAEDAFQATFVILHRKAASLGKPASIRSWLYTVAVRVAQRARAQSARRREQEKQVAVPVETAGSSVEMGDLRRVLDEELCLLPTKYLDAVLLCYLEGKTNEEAAAELGCPVGTIWTRLSRGRDMLRARLVRRGLTLSAGAIAGVLAEPCRAAVPGTLAAATVKAVSLSAIGNAFQVGGLSSHVLALADGVLRTMWLAKVKAVAVVAAALLVMVGSGGWVIHSALAGRTFESVAQSNAVKNNEFDVGKDSGPGEPAEVLGNVALASRGAKVLGVEHQAVHLNDGQVAGAERLASGRLPCTWIVELPRVYPLTTVRLALWDRTDRYYCYVLEGSVDGVTYEVLADRSTGKWRSWQTITFAARPIRFLKVRGLFNSEGDAFHLKELEAYCRPPETSVTPAFPSEP